MMWGAETFVHFWQECKLGSYFVESESHSVLFNSAPHGLNSPWNPPGGNTAVGSLSLLQGIFATQGLNLGLLDCRWFLYQLRHNEQYKASLEKQKKYHSVQQTDFWIYTQRKLYQHHRAIYAVLNLMHNQLQVTNKCPMPEEELESLLMKVKEKSGKWRKAQHSEN